MDEGPQESDIDVEDEEDGLGHEEPKRDYNSDVDEGGLDVTRMTVEPRGLMSLNLKPTTRTAIVTRNRLTYMVI
jgi:hypothetical protein